VFGDNSHDIVRVCWGRLILGFLCFATFGALAFFISYAVDSKVNLQVNKTPFNAWAVAATAFALSQTLSRADIAGTRDVKGLPYAKGSKESFYNRGLRTLISTLYRRLLQGSEDPAPILRRGLVEVYSERELVSELESWARTKPHHDADALIGDAKNTLKDADLPREEKRDIIALRLIVEDIDFARHLAERRASAIVEKRAF